MTAFLFADYCWRCCGGRYNMLRNRSFAQKCSRCECKVNWFARQNKLICWEEQLSFETWSSSLAHEYHRDGRAKSLKLPSKFIEFADQIQWDCWPNSMNLQNSALSFWLSCTCNDLVLLVAKQRWRYAIFALKGGAEVTLVLVTQMIADGGKVVGSW